MRYKTPDREPTQVKVGRRVGRLPLSLGPARSRRISGVNRARAGRFSVKWGGTAG